LGATAHKQNPRWPAALGGGAAAYNSAMRVAWDLQAVTGPGRTGLGVSVQFMLDAVINHTSDIELVGLRPNRTDAALRSVADRLQWEQWRLPAQLRAEHRRRALTACYSPALAAPLLAPVPVVAHVHDLIPLIYPSQFSGVAGWYWGRLLPFTWRRCRLLTVSNAAVADDVAARLVYPRERIHVVPYYPDPTVAKLAAELNPDYRDIAARLVPQRPLFLTLASHEPRKNLELPIRALRLLHKRGINARLVCIGGLTPHTESLRILAATCGVASAVEFVGYQQRRATVELLLNCTALVFASRYEGYGMPPQEAQSLGCPAILSDIRCHRVVYADQLRFEQLPEELRVAPAFVNPDDEQGLALEMQRLCEDQEYRVRLGRAGLAYSATFSSAATAHAWRGAFAAVESTGTGAETAKAEPE
jgi:glycosyltransferase involved in cell wall biosynthesis